MILCITGMPGSGKSETAKVLAAKGYKLYELSSVVWELMHKAGIERTSENTKQFATMIRRKYGKEVTAKFLLRKIKLKRGGRIAIVGVRSIAELDYIKKRSKTITLALVAPPKLRFARIRKRKRPDDPKSLSQFIRNRDRKEIAFGINGAISHADYIIANTGTKAELERNVERVLSQIE